MIQNSQAIECLTLIGLGYVNGAFTVKELDELSDIMESYTIHKNDDVFLLDMKKWFVNRTVNSN
jgi:hypothetical protein